MWNMKTKSIMSSIVLNWSPPLPGSQFLKCANRAQGDKPKALWGSLLLSWPIREHSHWTTQPGEDTAESYSSPEIWLQFQFPGTTEECGNRIHGERLYVANIPKLSKCTNKQSTSWWHRNYEAETIIITHVCFYSPLTRDTSTPKTPGQQQKK